MDNIKSIIKNKLKEMMSTSQGGASFKAGEGMNYATPFAFKGKKGKKRKLQPYFKSGYKMVPDTIEGSKLETVRIFEGELTDFQKERIAAFDDIEHMLNEIYPLLSNAKNDTTEFYQEHPGSFEVYKPTEMVINYLKTIKKLLTDQ